jgi:hypothetical protein
VTTRAKTKTKPKPLLFAFALSRLEDGRIESWTEDNAIGAIIAPSLSDAKMGILKTIISPTMQRTSSGSAPDSSGRSPRWCLAC